jgi:cell division protein FtsQ
MWFRKRNRRQAAPSQRGEPALASAMRKRLLIVTGIASGGVVLIWAVLALLDRPVHRVEVVGQFHRVSPLQVEQAVMTFGKAPENVGRGFVSLRLDELKSAIERIEWVDRVRVERRWPDGVRVTVAEQIPGARWGEHGLLNSRGELFLKEARYVPPELPQLFGPDGTEEQVARLYLDTYPRLAGVGLRLARVTLDPRGAWELMVTSAQNTNGNGVAVRLGRQDVQARLERFIAAASPLIATRPADLSYIDMRYSNGFAVGWLPSARVAGASERTQKGTT